MENAESLVIVQPNLALLTTVMPSFWALSEAKLSRIGI
jgi:hypothetical protein